MMRPAQQEQSATTTTTQSPAVDLPEAGEHPGRGFDAVERRGASPGLGLPARCFILVFAVILALELLVALPIIASHRRTWLLDRASSGRAAAFMLGALSDRSGAQDDRIRGLLDALDARAAAFDGPGGRRLLGIVGDGANPGRIDILTEDTATSLTEALKLLVADASRPVWLVGQTVSRQSSAGVDHRLATVGAADAVRSGRVDLLISEAPLQDSLRAFGVQLVVAFLCVAAAAAGLISLVVQRSVVRPVRRLARNMGEFASDPESIDHSPVPSRRSDEIGKAEAALARMQWSLAGELRERRRLAGLGLSVSKINHELRNLLTTAQLLSDRLDGVADPVVQRVAPRLIATLDRAIRFCEATLAYGRATEPYPQRRRVPLGPLLAEMEDLTRLSPDTRLRIAFRVDPDLSIYIDPEQFSRALTNIVRNAVQALDAAGTQEVTPLVTITAYREVDGEGGRIVILVADNGPGLPDNARATLFAPFQGSMRAGGTGLGLAIASELVRLNGGTLDLDEGTTGACFRIAVPDRAPDAKAA